MCFYKMAKMAVFIAILAILWLGCAKQKFTDEDLLWEYYRGFSYAPALFDSLTALATNPETKDFFAGLKRFEVYSQDEIPAYYDTAFTIFSGLQSRYPENYLGHLGMALLLTERGMVDGEAVYFDSAVVYYEAAYNANRSHPAIYYYRGRNEYNRNKNVVNENAIHFLDTATQLKPDFFKAAERSARFLSHYLDLAYVNTSVSPLNPEKNKDEMAQAFNEKFPQARDRVRYLFQQSLAIDPSWYETYQDIANAHHAYSEKERLEFLLKGIEIAKKKKSKDSLKLIKALANVYFFDLNDYQKARAEYGQWISQHGAAADLVNLAWCQYFLGQPEATHALMRAAMAEDKSGLSHLEYALFLKEMGDFPEALQLVDSALARTKKSSSLGLAAFVEKAKLLEMEGNTAQSRKILAELAANPKTTQETLKAKVLQSLNER